MPQEFYTELTFKTLKELIQSLQEIEKTLSNAHKELDRAIRHKRLNSSYPSTEEVKGIRRYLLREDLNEKRNRSVLKTLITLISNIQDAQRGLIDLAQGMKDGDDEENTKGKSRKGNKKSDSRRDKEKDSKVRSFLDNPKPDFKNASAPRDHSFQINKKGYILGFAEKDWSSIPQRGF